MDSMPKIESQEIITHRFVWRDGDKSCSAGELLCAVTLLAESQNPDNYIDSPEVTDYLKDKGLIEQTGEHRFKPAENKLDDLVALGDDISKAIGDEIENLPVNVELKLAPSIHLLNVNIF